MYESHFDMSRTPFVRDIPTESLFESPVITEILGPLSYVADHQLLSQALLTAGLGCGKSTMIRKFTQMLPRDKYTLLYLSDSKLTPRWFYKGLLDQLGIESKFYRGDAKRQLHKEIEIIREVRKRQVVCVLDEAHLLEKETLEEFRFLLNFNYDSISPMALILVGQSELLDKLKLQCYTAIRQRIDMNCILPRLERSDTEAYIRSHLRYAGCEHGAFFGKSN